MATPARFDVPRAWRPRIETARGPSWKPSAWVRWGRHVVLFVVTAVSVTMYGGQEFDGTFDWTAGTMMATSLLAVLFAHEMGHYLASRYHRVDATLPFFIPSPWLPLAGLGQPWMPLGFGTFGAVIRIRSPFPNRRALFDIGIAGPLAGFAVAVPVLVLAAREAVFGPEAVFAGGLSFGEPPLFRWAMEALVGTPPPGTTTIIGPFGRAAWFGLLVTALNLMPIGQLDGGHVTYALFGRRAFSLSRAMWWMSLVLVVLVGPSFLLWTVLVRVLGFRHPRTLDDDAPVGRARALVGVLGLAVFLLCFTPSPFPGMTWGFVGDALRELFSYLTGR